MNTLIEIFRDSFVVKIFLGIITFLLTTVANVEGNNDASSKAKYKPLANLEIQKKIIEIGNTYFNDYQKSTK